MPAVAHPSLTSLLMNPTLAISLLYGLMALGSINILFFSFKGKIDYSGKFFLCAEILTVLTIAVLALLSIDPGYKRPWVFFIGNASYIASEISILFSIYALTHRVSIRKYLLALTGGLAYNALIEYCRTIEPTLPLLLQPLVFVLLAGSTTILCVLIRDDALRSNPFLTWFKYLEIGLATLAVLRIAIYFSGIAITPVGSNSSSVVLFAIYIAINLSRYISYQSLRMTWVPDTGNNNFLNNSLARSVHENNQLLRELMNSNRMLGVSALAGALAHELSQPLIGAALETESIKRDLARPGRQADAAASLNKVSLQLGKLSELVRNLRKLFGTKTVQFHAFELASICDEVLDLLEPTSTARKISIARAYRVNPTVCGEPIQIQQVLINLLNNAIEALSISQGDEKQIILRIDQRDSLAILTVEDNGVGIANDLLPTVFELYKTTKEKGMGIGLWLCRTIVTQHAGHISAANKTGGGAIFEVQLPLAEV